MEAVVDHQGTMHAALNGQTLVMAKYGVYWATLKTGEAMPIQEIRDNTSDNLPWYDLKVVGYDGKEVDFTDLNERTRDEILSEVIDILY